MDVETKKKISKQTQKLYEVTSLHDSTYRKVWKKQSLVYHCKKVYGVSLLDWLEVYKGSYRGFIIKRTTNASMITGLKETISTEEIKKKSMKEFVKNNDWRKLRDMRRKRKKEGVS